MAVRGADIEDHPVTIGKLGASDVTDVGGGGQAGRKVGGVGTEAERAYGGVDQLIDANDGVKILEEVVFAGAGTLSGGFVDGVLSVGLRKPVPIRISFLPAAPGPTFGRFSTAAQSPIC